MLNIYGKTSVSVISQIMYVFSVLIYKKNFNILNVCMYKKTQYFMIKYFDVFFLSIYLNE